jgi:signal transduction histidine kinase/Flp pilus assembly protein TadD
VNKLFFLAALLFSFTAFFSQNQTDIDSLQTLLKEETVDTLQINYLNEIAKNYYRNYPDSGIFYAEQALSRSNKLFYLNGLARSNRIIGLAYSGKSDYTTALDYLFKALEYAGKSKDYSYYALTLTSIGIVYRKIAEYDKALRYYLNSLRLIRIEGDPQKISSALNNVGIIYKIIGDTEEAVKYYTESLEINQRIDNKRGIAFNLANLGNIYKENNDYINARIYFEKALALFEELDFKNEIAHVYNALGIIYMNNKDYISAFEFIRQANNIYSHTENLSGTAESYLNLGQIYFNQNKYEAARSAINLGLKIAKNVGAKENILNSYFFLSKIDSIQGNFKSALENYQKYTLLNDSIFSKERSKTISEIKEKYALAEKERENEFLKKNKELQDAKLKKQGIVNISAAIILVLLLFVLFLIVFSYKRVKTINKELSKKNDEIRSQNLTLLEYKDKINTQYEKISIQNEQLEDYKNKLESIVNKRTKQLNKALIKAQNSDRLKTQFLENLSHEVRTPINAITGLSAIILKGERNLKPEYIYAVRRGMDDLMNTIDRLVLISKLQLGTYDVTFESINLSLFFQEFQQRVIERKEFLQKDLIHVEFPELYENLPVSFVTDKFILESVLNEIIDNAFKFTGKGLISIFLTHSENALIIKVKDSGVGIKEEIKKHVYELMRKFDKDDELYRGMGIGLALVKMALDLISGTIQIESVYKEGAELTVRIPSSNTS